MASSGFLCICPQKTVEFGDKNKLRDAKAQQLAKELGFDGTDVESSEGMLLCGGGIRVFDPTDSLGTATLDNCAVVFQGVLSNGKELLGMRIDADNVQITANQAATIVCSLYAHHGVNMVPVLEGQYAFCLYDAKQGRVLAARDASGSVPLRQARSSEDSLIISTCAQLPEGSHDAEDISAGSFKYGWHASPRPFTPNKPLGDMHPTCHRQQPVSLPSSKATSPTVRQGLVAELDAAQQHLAAMVSPLAPVPEHAGRGKGRPGMQQEERRHSMEERTRGRRSMDARRSSIEQPRRHSIDSHKVQQEHAGHGRRSLDLQPGRADANNSWTRKEQPASAQKGGQRTRSSRQQAGSNSHKKPAQPGMPDSWHVVHHHHGHAGSQQQGRSVTPKAAAAQASKAKAMADGNIFDALGSETESICSRASSRSSSDSLRSHGSGASRGSRRSHGSSKGSPAASPITEAAAAAAASAAVAGLAPASSGPSPKPPRTRSGSSAADSEAAAGNMARLMANLLGPSMPAAPQPAAVAPLELWSASAAPEPVVPAGGATLKETRSPSCGDLVAMMAAGDSPPAAMPGLAH